MSPRLLAVLLVTLLAGCAAARPERPRGVRKAAAAAGRTVLEDRIRASKAPAARRELPAAPPLLPRYRPGDFAPPNALLVAYDEEWEEPMVNLIEAAREEVDVYVLANPDELSNYKFFAWLSRHDADVVFAAHDTPWVRDFGPMQVFDERGRILWLDFQYSTERLQDDLSPTEVATHLGMPIEAERWWLDGGALLSNGRGLCAITDDSFASVGIDGADPDDYADFLRTVGCEELAIVPALPGEETGHADLIAQFLSDSVIAISEADRREAPLTAQALEDATLIIRHASEKLGQPLEIVRAPLRVRGRRFYSYVNVTRLPGKLLVPRYGPARDLESRAYDILSTALPGVVLVPVDSDTMIARGGAVHCVTLGMNLLRRDRRLARAPRRWLGAEESH